MRVESLVQDINNESTSMRQSASIYHSPVVTFTRQDILGNELSEQEPVGKIYDICAECYIDIPSHMRFERVAPTNADKYIV